MATTPSSVLALDVGDKRIGVAVASLAARLPRPLVTLERQADDLLDILSGILETEQAAVLVVGLPRGLAGQDTGQTAATETFIAELRQRFSVPIETQDEALTSHKAEQELTARNKPFKKGDIDALAATYILEDWLEAHKEYQA